MKRLIKYVVFSGLITLGLVCVFLVGKKIRQSNSQAVVLPAIDMKYAKRMVKENECYIIEISNPEKIDEKYCYIKDGKKTPIVLCGREPSDELSYVFL